MHCKKDRVMYLITPSFDVDIFVCEAICVGLRKRESGVKSG